MAWRNHAKAAGAETAGVSPSCAGKTAGAAAAIALILFAGWALCQAHRRRAHPTHAWRRPGGAGDAGLCRDRRRGHRPGQPGRTWRAWLRADRRTSIDHATSSEVDLERDELSVYPLLYWPVAASSRRLSDQAKEKLNRYLSTGGMVLIDTRAGAAGGANDIGKIIQGIDIPALIRIPAGHILTKSFYLLNDFPGRLSGGDLWG